MMKLNLKTIGFIAPLILVFQGCSYKLTGTSIPVEMKTVSVQFFENGASTVVPNLSTLFTEALKERIRTQSRLSMVARDGDGTFEGRITDYRIAPEAIQANNVAGLVRLTITVQVKYTNSLNPKDSFEQSFSANKQFSNATQTIQSQEQGLIRDINTQLTENIFNRAFANW